MDNKLILAVFSAGILSLSACGLITETSNQLTVKNYKDSLVTKVGTVGCNVYVSIDYPEKGNTVLLNNIREWMLDEMGSTQATDMGNAVSLTKGYIDSSMKELKGTADEMDGYESAIPYEYRLDINKIYENGKFVTFKTTGYEYMGGAHGSTYMKGTTFRKSDGKIFGSNMLDLAKQTDIRELIEERLLSYFEVKTSEELKDILFLQEGEDLIPMPATEPYIDNDEMVFVYQQYEIAPYAAGMPEARIPLKKLMPYLSSSFKNAYF